MTSTVLDVTLLLLCVSASVVVLGGVEGRSDAGTDESIADVAADRIVTETATVTYDVTGGDHDSRTVHATLAELLVMAVEERGIDSGTSDPGAIDPRAADRFRAGAIEAVEHAMGPRTRLDVRYDADGRSETTREHGTSDRPPRTIGVGPEPPTDTDVSVAVVTHPASSGTESSEAGRFRIVVRTW